MTSCNHSSLHPKSVFTIDILLLMFIIYTHNIIFPLRYLGGKSREYIGGEGALYFVISFLQNGQLSFLYS